MTAIHNKKKQIVKASFYYLFLFIFLLEFYSSCFCSIDHIVDRILFRFYVKIHLFNVSDFFTRSRPCFFHTGNDVFLFYLLTIILNKCFYYNVFLSSFLYSLCRSLCYSFLLQSLPHLHLSLLFLVIFSTVSAAAFSTLASTFSFCLWLYLGLSFCLYFLFCLWLYLGLNFCLCFLFCLYRISHNICSYFYIFCLFLQVSLFLLP